MGVSTNFYTIFGVKLDWNDAFHEAYEAKYDELAVSVIVDGMSGEYIILGNILHDSGDMRYGFEDCDTAKEYDIKELKKLEKAYRTAFAKQFPNFLHLIDTPFKVITLAHYH
jgi:hypothetical protein